MVKGSRPVQRRSSRRRSRRPSIPDVTPKQSASATASTPAPASPPANPRPRPQFESDDAYDFFRDPDIDDFEIVARDSSPLRIVRPRSRIMAAEFAEGRLETTVGSPQKELPGTKDAYVSYQVTTKVPIHLLQLRNTATPCA